MTERTAVVVLAEGVEEIEAVTVVDVLRRAGWTVTVAGLAGADTVTASRGVRIVPDAPFDAQYAQRCDVLVLPGGMGGVRAMQADAGLMNVVRRRLAQRQWVAAICAAPLVLRDAGGLDARRFACHPGVSAEVSAEGLASDAVVVDAPLLTSRGPGTALAFALAIVATLDDAAHAERLAAEMVASADDAQA